MRLSFADHRRSMNGHAAANGNSAPHAPLCAPPQDPLRGQDDPEVTQIEKHLQGLRLCLGQSQQQRVQQLRPLAGHQLM